jgi:hypothetical protein
MGERRGAYVVLVGKRELQRPHGRRRRRWENNIKMDIQEIGLGTWIGLFSLRIGKNGGEFFMWETIRFFNKGSAP